MFGSIGKITPGLDLSRYTGISQYLYKSYELLLLCPTWLGYYDLL